MTGGGAGECIRSEQPGKSLCRAVPCLGKPPPFHFPPEGHGVTFPHPRQAVLRRSDQWLAAHRFLGQRMLFSDRSRPSPDPSMKNLSVAARLLVFGALGIFLVLCVGTAGLLGLRRTGAALAD